MGELKTVADATALAALVFHNTGDIARVGSSDEFTYDEASTAAHDGSDVVRPSNRRATQPGRWLRRTLTGNDLAAAVLGGVTLKSGAADPSADAGVAAAAPALYVRTNGQVWVKTGSGDTAWARLALASELS